MQSAPTAKIAFIGSGRMATAIVNGLLKNQVRQAADLACIGSPTDTTAQQLARQTGIRLAQNHTDLLADADTVVLAIKPQQLAALAPALAQLTSGKLILSILAGKTTAALSKVFPNARNIIRAMPNTPGAIGAGITGWCSAKELSETDRRQVAAILDALGRQVAVAENQLDAITALSGSGPAYVFEFAAALREAGIAAGLTRETAQQLAVETILGSAKLMTETGTEPEELRNQVTSPNGTTFAGLEVMRKNNFRQLIAATVSAAKLRSEELSRD